MEKTQFTYTAAINTGGRESNQDNLRLDLAAPCVDPDINESFTGSFNIDGTHVFCVCDGMGGEAMGELASITALEAVDVFLKELDPESIDDLPTLARLTADAANSAVGELYARMKLRGGCTFTMLMLRADRYCLLNIGDSPAFLCRDGRLTELSLRHNLEQYNILRGEPVNAGDSSVLLYYLGMPRSDAGRLAHLESGRVHADDAFLICSDGITNAWSAEALTTAIEAGARAEDLVNCAIRLDYADNSTAVLIRC